MTGDIFDLMREIGEDTPEQDLMTAEMLEEAGLTAEDMSGIWI